ncbi:MAG: N-acetyl-gamma-glutamyl-phosphate reductase [Coriobacteriia bacterium]|nr:N-acetyl-gamma-glutamyl-phosphate reductase [Coriobacteriia bacterium]
MTDVAVIGAAGYAGIELVRLLLAHPTMRPVVVTSGADAGRRLDELYPALTGLTDLVLVEPDTEAVAARAQVAFLAVPHTAAMAIAPRLLAAGVTVVDASADFRLKDAAAYERWYGVRHEVPELLSSAVYGLPELDRSGLPGATLVACPGCYPTATLIAAAPALQAGLLDGDRVTVDAKSGVSGAGRGAGSATHFPAVNESAAPYSVASHRHTPEIEQGLSAAAGVEVRAAFAPHLVPMTRGLLSTVYVPLRPGVTAAEVREAYSSYSSEPFVTVHPDGRMPSTLEVRGSNRAHVGLAVDERAGVLIAACAIDNLVKGTSGQAVQCANLALGLPETEGLMTPVPVV